MMAIGFALLCLVACIVGLDNLEHVEMPGFIKAIAGLAVIVGVILIAASLAMFLWQHMP